MAPNMSRAQVLAEQNSIEIIVDGTDQHVFVDQGSSNGYFFDDSDFGRTDDERLDLNQSTKIYDLESGTLHQLKFRSSLRCSRGEVVSDSFSTVEACTS